MLTKNQSYTGKFASQADQITFKIYQDTEGGLRDVRPTPPTSLAGLPDSAIQGEGLKPTCPTATREKAGGQ